MSESHDEIMEATYKALCKHGYAELSIQNIADEFEKGKSLIYYHFEDKQDLMKAFMDHMKDEIKQMQKSIDEEDPVDELDSMLDIYLGIERDEMWEFQKAFQEFRAQAQHNPEFREKFRQIDKLVIENTAEKMREAGACNAEMASEMFLSLIEGAVVRKVSTGDKQGLEELKEEINNVVAPLLEK